MIQEKFIDGYNGEYSINSLGEIFSFKKAKTCIMKPYTGNHGYSVVVLSNKKQKQALVHRLVAEAFIPNSENKPCVNHKNGVRTDNRVENLEWMSYSENHIHSFRELGRKGGRLGKPGIKSQLGKLGKDHQRSRPVIQLSMSGEFICEFNDILEAKRSTGVNNTNISTVCKGKRSHAGGFKWKYKIS